MNEASTPASLSRTAALVWWLVVWVSATSLTALGAETFRSLYISELQSDPEALADADGVRSGWVELTNGGDTPVSLKGWFLTDDQCDLTRWRFPEIVLPPDKTLIVLTSGRDRTNDLVRPSASFRLEPRGGYLALVGRNTNIVSEFHPGYPALSPGTSFGRIHGEPALTGVFVRPTPGRPNATSGSGFAPEVGFSQSSGTFQEPFELRLSRVTGKTAGPTNGARVVIRYTLDGTMPTRSSAVYDAPLAITNTTHLRVRAYQDGFLPGPPAGATYLLLERKAAEFSSTLPLLVLDTFGQDRSVSGRASVGHLFVFEPVGGRASLTNEPGLVTRAGHRVRGSSSAGMPQSSFALEFLDEFNAERAHPLLGLPADSDWILYAPNSYDPVLIHNPFVHQLSRDLGRYSPRTRFVEMLVVSGNGRVRAAHYHGIHVLEEKIKIGRHRVNIDPLGANDVSPPAVTGGYLLKIDRLGPDEGGAQYLGDRSVVYVEPREQTILLPQRAAQRRYLAGFLRDFEQALDGPDWKHPDRGYRAFLDVDAAIDFHVIEVLSGNVDALVLSTFWHKPRQGRIVFGPHWDFDRALGSTDGRDDDPRMWNTGQFFFAPWWDRLFTDVDFWQLWVDRWQDLRRTHFALTNLHGLADRLAAEIREAQPRQYQRWDFQPRGGSYAAELAHMKSWLTDRIEFIDSQLVSPPAVSRRQPTGSPGFVTFSAPTNVTIYYTLDGSDPRQAQGGISSNALVYSVPVVPPAAASVTVRGRDPRKRQTGGPPRSTPWSSPRRIEPSVTAR